LHGVAELLDVQPLPAWGAANQLIDQRGRLLGGAEHIEIPVGMPLQSHRPARRAQPF